MNEQNQHLDALQDIRQMMQRSSRFISLSGLSGIAAGIWALIGAWFAYDWIYEGKVNNRLSDYEQSGSAFSPTKLGLNLVLLAGAVLAASLVSAFYFTWRKTARDKVSLWNHSSKMLTLNMVIPLITGGLFILALIQNNEWRFIAPSCLIFYGLALVNASKYTVSDIRYLGICEIVLGLINTQFIGYGLHFWAIGFGVLHIIYGFIMWWKYERKEK